MKTQEQIEKLSWDMALGFFLSEYPENKAPSDILSLIEEQSDEVMVWQPFEYNDPEWIIEQILMTQISVKANLDWVQEETK